MRETSKAEPKIPLREKIKSVPGFFGLHLNEQPPYKILMRNGPLELRAYAAQTLAQVTIDASFERYRKAAFMKLARYIFGDNADCTTVAMTSPVLQEDAGESAWRMSFILPHHYTAATAPKPSDPDVRVISQPPRVVLVMRYSGNNTERKMRAMARKLSKWIHGHPLYRQISDVWWAQYDAPKTIPFLKRNEAHVEVLEQH
jgi:hypothetical protein